MKRLLALLALAGALVGALAPRPSPRRPPTPPHRSSLAQAAGRQGARGRSACGSPPRRHPPPRRRAAAPAAAAAARRPNKGDNAWMIVATLLVIMMSIPGLALFYGGLVRSKNMLSVLMQVFVVFSLIIVLWAVYGYSIAFTEGNAFFGGFDRLFLTGIFSIKDGVGLVRDRGDVQQGRGDSRVSLRRVPGDVRGDHRRADRRRVRRADEVLGGAAVRGAVVHVRLPADRAHGLVLARPGRHQGRGDARVANRRRPAGCGRRARSTSPAAPSCTSTPASPAWSAPTWSASASATARIRWRRTT